MSWNVHHPSRSAFEVDHRSFSNGEPPADQLAVARAAVEDIIGSGCIGGEDKEFHVAIFGHTNPNHEPREGYADDCLTITVTQKKRDAAPRGE